MPDDKMDQKRSGKSESDLKKMQQNLVDETVDESFPASDPPAWTTTGSRSVAARGGDARRRGSADRAGRSESDEDRSREGLMDRASDWAEEARRTGERYLDEVRHRYPEAERYYRRGREAVARPVETYPLTAVLLAAVVGYGLAWLIHGRSGDESRRRRMPAYGRRPRIGARGREAEWDADDMPGRGDVRARSGAMASSSAPSSY